MAENENRVKLFQHFGSMMRLETVQHPIISHCLTKRRSSPRTPLPPLRNKLVLKTSALFPAEPVLELLLVHTNRTE